MILNKKQELRLQTTGRIHWFDQKNNLFYKIYKKDNLLDDAGALKSRLSQIVELSSTLEFIPEISYSFENDLLIMKQNKLVKDIKLDKIESSKKKHTLIKEFAKSLDKLHDKGFVHGDINRKNIIYSNDRLRLIDFEPSLLQIKNHAMQWMSTRPYVHHDDMKNNTITIKSDLLGFGCFVSWFLMYSSLPQDYADECSEIINEQEVEFNPFKNLVEIILEKINARPPPLSQEDISKCISRIGAVQHWNDFKDMYLPVLQVAIYLRELSSYQVTDKQLIELFELCNENRWEVTGLYEETILVTKDTDEQPEWDRMVSDISQKKFSKVVVWSEETLSISKLSQMDNLRMDIFFINNVS